MSDLCWTPGCKGRILPSRNLRATVARGGECPECGAVYRRFGSGDWKFVTEELACATVGCEGKIDFQVIPKHPSEATCYECGVKQVRSPDGAVTVAS